jgi:hypothetical protein
MSIAMQIFPCVAYRSPAVMSIMQGLPQRNSIAEIKFVRREMIRKMSIMTAVKGTRNLWVIAPPKKYEEPLQRCASRSNL